MLIVSPFLGIGIYNPIKVANIDSTISIILGYLLSFIILFLFIKINDYKINLNLKDKVYTLFNKNIATIITIILSLSFFVLACVLLYNINSFVITQFLSETPMIFIAIILGLLIIYINSKGIETITRVATLLFFIGIFLTLFDFIGQYNRIEFINLKPILVEGIKRPIVGSLYIIIINTIYAFVALVIPKNNIINNKNMNKALTITMSLSFILFFATTCFTIGSFGIDLASLYQYPAYMVLKEISILNFIDKIENFIIIHWIIEIFITISLVTYFINKMTDIKSYIIVTMMIICMFFFKNSTFFNYFVTNFIPIFSVIIMLCMSIICIKITTKKRLSK